MSNSYLYKGDEGFEHLLPRDPDQVVVLLREFELIVARVRVQDQVRDLLHALEELDREVQVPDRAVVAAHDLVPELHVVLVELPLLDDVLLLQLQVVRELINRPVELIDSLV